MTPKYEEAVKYFKMKRWDSALQTFQEVDGSVLEEEQKIELAYYLGLCYTKLERYNDAVIYLEQVVAGNAGNLRISQCRLTLAFIYLNTRRYKMAEFELERLIKGGLRSPQIYTMLGFSAWNQKKGEQAVDCYEKALEIEAGNATALNGLGFILVETGQDALRGLELCKKAVEKRPTSPAYLDSLGWAYYKTGEMVEARSYLRRALDLAPRQKEISRHMKAVVGGEAS
ncbi:MAG: tetratricopeptide repeat protein [Spirochaetaceae bacterium]|jgi:tetratricopeptide (TPR) repeat protein|nr:tetratricopeptide repeat protein [Spirochaetaceae bacterium]